MVAQDGKGNWLVNPKIILHGAQYPNLAHNWQELVEEIRERNRETVWFTYRKGFEPLKSSSSTSDAGWGCMIRTGQMLLHEAIRRHTGGEKRVDLFLDRPEAPFGIHRISEAGLSLGKRPGEWYGP